MEQPTSLWEEAAARIYALDPDTLTTPEVDVATGRHYRRANTVTVDAALMDFQIITSAARIGMVPRSEYQKLIDRMSAVTYAIRAAKQDVDNQIAELSAMMTMITGSTNPVQLVAIEQLFMVQRLLQAFISQIKHADSDERAAYVGALEIAKVCDAYCWSPDVVEAVSDAATHLPMSSKATISGMGQLVAPRAAGWWWFDKAIPVSGHKIHAMMWHRAYVPSTGAEGGTRFWVFEMKYHTMYGRTLMVPTPTALFEWPDNLDLAGVVERWAKSNNNNWPLNRKAEGEDISSWFVRFWLAAGTWLQSKVITKEETKLPRQPGRALAREHKLDIVPTVHVIHLRKSSHTKSGTVVEGEGAARTYTHRWVVHGFWRNQWYPTRQEHALIWISDFIKGPGDKPLVTKTRVYAVDR